MFAAGDLVVYGGEGVCRVVSVGTPEIRGADRTRLYYTLEPMGRTGQVMTPVDTKVLLRGIISREQAQELVARLPQLPPLRMESTGIRATKEFYQAVVASYDCEQTAALIKLLEARRREALAGGKKMSQMEERYLKRAEEQFSRELGAALGLDRDALAAYIADTSPDWTARCE